MSAINITQECADIKLTDRINARITELKAMVFPGRIGVQGKVITKQAVLDKVVELVVGSTSSGSSGASTPSTTSSESPSPSVGGPIRTKRQEYKKSHEQGRRNKEAVAYIALKEFITDNKLTSGNGKLEKLQVLNVMIKYLKEHVFAPPVRTPLPFSIESILAMQPSPLAPTPPMTPLDPLQGYPTLRAILQRDFAVPPVNEENKENEDDDENI